MLFKLLIVFSLLSTIKTKKDKNLVDLPLKVAEGGTVINATLTDAIGSKKYFIQELISASGSTIKGKIVISSDKDSYTINYAVPDTGVDSKQRLVIHGSECLLLTYKGSWDKNLPGIEKPLLNAILLMGPSILYRLDHSVFVWEKGGFKDVRGSIMKSATAEINKNLKITCYYKDSLDDETGIDNPSRIEFISSLTPKEDLILDIYLQSESKVDKLQNEVQPLPGIGCPHYLSGIKDLPALRAYHLQYTMYEYTQGSTNSKSFNEVHAAQFYNFLRLKTTSNGKTTETINDYVFGASFQIKSMDNYQTLAVEKTAPGVNNHDSFTLSALLMLDGAFKYLGKVNLKHRNGIAAEAWESVQYNVNVNGKTVDKAVITQFFTKSNAIIFWRYTLVSTKISIYKYDEQKQVYTWSDGITRDYMSFKEIRTTESILSLKEKVEAYHSDGTLILNFILECDDLDPSQESCLKHTEERVDWLKGDFLYYVLLARPVSIFRISDIQYRFTDSRVEMEVTFIDVIDLKYVYTSKFMTVGLDSVAKMKHIKIKTEDDCINTLKSYNERIEAVLYQDATKDCGYLTHIEDLKEDIYNGSSGSVYRFPFHNLKRVKQELTLDKIHDAYLKNVGQTYSLFDGNEPISFKLTNVIDKTGKATDPNKDIITQVRWTAKLKIEDQFTVPVTAKTFSECYRNCHESETLSCNILSFCDNGKGGISDCRVSSLQSSDVMNKDEHVEHATGCSIFSVNILESYSKISNRKLKNPTSKPLKTYLDTCAQSCHAASNCTSFQFCGSYCSFGDSFTDVDTQYDVACELYYPKAFEKYQKTGTKIVSDVFYTETKVTLDQCASLCYEMSDGDTGCQSFNFCPKSRTESYCSLTKFSVKNATKIIEGGECSNYELKDQSSGKKSQGSSSIDGSKGMSGGSAFGVIMLFLTVGALLGFISPFVYSKVKQMRANGTGWTRQVDSN